MADQKKVCIVGSGNWGSVIAKIVGNNVREDDRFARDVPMYVYEEMVDGKKLTEIINTQHENIKYLPGCIIPDNVVANPDIVESTKDADILIFVLPHQFIRGICKTLKGKLKPGAIGISLIKGLDISDKGLDLISNVLRTELDIGCAVLMGANIAPEVARENYCEATIGCKNVDMGRTLKNLFQTPYFRIVVVEDEETVELCGALKEVLYIAALIADGYGWIANTKAAIVRLGFIESNVVAVGAGFVEGLSFGDNTKAAVIRLGLMEMVKFIEEFYQKSKIDTFLESCGVADLVTTCYSGRNMKVARAFVNSGKTIEDLEREMLNGQKLQGPPTAAEVNAMLKSKDMEDRFPLFTAIHKICVGELKPDDFLDCLKNHPEHM